MTQAQHQAQRTLLVQRRNTNELTYCTPCTRPSCDGCLVQDDNHQLASELLSNHMALKAK